MKKIILCPNPARDSGLAYAKKYYDFFEKAGAEVYICPVLTKEWGGILPDGNYPEFENVMIGADAVIVFGGDGTILHVARKIASTDIPILGVNLGKKGFIAELEHCDDNKILKIIDGDYTIENRMMLDVSVRREGREVLADFALNDIVVGGIARIIDITVSSDDGDIITFPGDGLVVATPTGSTAYSMSAGGPIVEPSVENIIITPVCAHILMAKSYILRSDRKVCVTIGRLGTKSAYVSTDGGQSFNLHTGDNIVIKRSEFVTRLVKLSDTSFYEKVSKKLGELR